MVNTAVLKLWHMLPPGVLEASPGGSPDDTGNNTIEIYGKSINLVFRFDGILNHCIIINSVSVDVKQNPVGAVFSVSNS